MTATVTQRLRRLTEPVQRPVHWLTAGVDLARLMALAATGVLLFSFLVVLHGIVDVTGDPGLFYWIVAISLLAATALSRVLRVALALAIAAIGLVAGLTWYMIALSHPLDLLPILESNVELLTGQTLLQIKGADIWALGVVPTPVFVTWYLALRRWYVGAALVGGTMLGYLVLTGDAGTTVTLLGVVAGAAMVGFGDLDARETSFGTVERIVAVLAVMVLAPLLVTVVPGGASTPITFLDSETTTMEDNIVEAGSEMDILGSIELSPEVRFTVTSEEPRYWRTGSFDRYTGTGWVRSNQEYEYDEVDLQAPPGRTELLKQEFQAESPLGTLPAAWRPVEVGPGVAGETLVTSESGLEYTGTLQSGESYEVTSAVLDPLPGELAAAGTAYPDQIEERYLQLPESIPDRVAERTDQITEDADNPYETAVLTEEWLEANREYSLDVDRPEGDIADAFLFEMDRGYCTYYATTMVTMLRTQDIPARMVTGYTTGEQVEDDRWVVRGQNSHAWVEVYFPDTGWVRFDPTPAGARENAEQTRLTEARTENEPNVDTNETEPETPTDPTDEPPDTTPSTPTPSTPETPTTPTLPDGNGGDANTPTPDDGDSEADGISIPSLPPREQLLLGSIVLIGAVAGIRQSGLVGRVRDTLAVRFQRRADPATDIERAHIRLLILLERRYRPRRTGESMRAYLDAIDAPDAARRLATLRERAVYAEDVSREAADEAIELVEQIRTENRNT